MLIVLGALLLISSMMLILALKPFKLKGTYTPKPAVSYQEAVDRIEAIRARESELQDLCAECSTILMTHGEKSETVIIFLHGFTSCPDQFRKLGEEYFGKGYNVYIPRQPRHGLTDRSGKPLKDLTAEELAYFGTGTADIAQGLGKRVIIVGLSGGGSLTTWLAQERKDVDLAVPISPFLGVGFIPQQLTRLVTNLFLLLPDTFQWWDPVNKINNPNSAPYSYRGYWLHALFENLRLGLAAETDARKVKPGAGAILVITNANDGSVNNDMVKAFERIWQETAEDYVRTYQFPKNLELPHDLITFHRPGGNPGIVYNKLLELIR